MQPPVALDARTARILPWLVAIAFFMQTLDGTILNTALPAMARDLAENPLRMQGVVIAYMLTVALLIPASGWIADRFGSRRIFVAAIVLFSLGSLLCALSTSFNQLVASRVLQALGGALMLPVGRLVVLRAFPRSEFVRIMAFIALPGLVGPLLGPTLGGWLVEYASWHWIFLINLPVGVIGCIAALRFMPDLKGPERVRFDTLGFVLFGAAMVLITIALEGLGEMHMPHARVMLLLFGGAACMAAYWLRAGRIDAPLFSPTLFHTRSFAVGIFGNLFARLGGGALPFLAAAGASRADRHGQLHAVHRDEHRHPDRPQPCRCQQRQQPAVGGGAAVDEPWCRHRWRAARRLHRGGCGGQRGAARFPADLPLRGCHGHARGRAVSAAGAPRPRPRR